MTRPRGPDTGGRGRDRGKRSEDDDDESPDKGGESEDSGGTTSRVAFGAAEARRREPEPAPAEDVTEGPGRTVPPSKPDPEPPSFDARRTDPVTTAPPTLDPTPDEGEDLPFGGADGQGEDRPRIEETTEPLPSDANESDVRELIAEETRADPNEIEDVRVTNDNMLVPVLTDEARQARQEGIINVEFEGGGELEQVPAAEPGFETADLFEGIESQDVQQFEVSEEGITPVLTPEARVERAEEQFEIERDTRRVFAGTERIPVGLEEEDFELKATEDGGVEARASDEALQNVFGVPSRSEEPESELFFEEQRETIGGFFGVDLTPEPTVNRREQLRLGDELVRERSEDVITGISGGVAATVDAFGFEAPRARAAGRATEEFSLWTADLFNPFSTARGTIGATEFVADLDQARIEDRAEAVGNIAGSESIEEAAVRGMMNFPELAMPGRVEGTRTREEGERGAEVLEELTTGFQEFAAEDPARAAGAAAAVPAAVLLPFATPRFSARLRGRDSDGPGFIRDTRGQADLTGPRARSRGESSETVRIESEDIVGTEAIADPTRGGRFGSPPRSGRKPDDPGAAVAPGAKPSGGGTTVPWRSAETEIPTAQQSIPDWVMAERGAELPGTDLRATMSPTAGRGSGPPEAFPVGVTRGAEGRVEQAQRPQVTAEDSFKPFGTVAGGAEGFGGAGQGLLDTAQQRDLDIGLGQVPGTSAVGMGLLDGSQTGVFGEESGGVDNIAGERGLFGEAVSERARTDVQAGLRTRQRARARGRGRGRERGGERGKGRGRRPGRGRRGRIWPPIPGLEGDEPAPTGGFEAPPQGSLFENPIATGAEFLGFGTDDSSAGDSPFEGFGQGQGQDQNAGMEAFGGVGDAGSLFGVSAQGGSQPRQDTTSDGFNVFGGFGSSSQGTGDDMEPFGGFGGWGNPDGTAQDRQDDDALSLFTG